MKQKLGISLIAAWYAIKGLMLMLIAVGIVINMPIWIGLPVGLLDITAVAIGIVALIAFALAYGIYNLEAWGWYIVVAVSGINIALAAIEMNVWGMGIPVIILLYLWANQDDFGVQLTNL